MPFIRVNTIMICGWVIIVLLFKMSKMEMTTCLSRQYGILILFGISAFVYFLWIYCPYFNKLYRNSERNDNVGPAVGFIRNGSLHVHICKRTIPVCIHALYSFNHCFCTFTILGFIQNQTKKTEKKKRKDAEKIIIETMTVN